MWRVGILTSGLLGLALAAGTTKRESSASERRSPVPRYLRVSTARWSISTFSPEAERIFHRIQTEGMEVFRAQPGFVSYRLARVDSSTTIAVAEWESESLGRAGAERYRAWMRGAGIMDRFTLTTSDGDIVVIPGSQPDTVR